ncbi:hypothetical protein BU17DRAFT_78545 [Hysterangium stoloniferum]|nr:hypothetical protein BU17DRAFT_78545 [Hysterangium stoloniferum]
MKFLAILSLFVVFVAAVPSPEPHAQLANRILAKRQLTVAELRQRELENRAHKEKHHHHHKPSKVPHYPQVTPV